jgi:hypothetical protein
MACKTKQEMMADLGADGYDSKQMRALNEAFGVFMEEPRSIDIDESSVFYHVTNEDWNPMELRTDDELGFHVGTEKVVDSYYEQRYKGKQAFIMKFEAKKDLNVVRLTDTPKLGGWDIGNVKKELDALDIDVESAETLQDVSKTLAELGYDAIEYANESEGVDGTVNSLVIVNKDAVTALSKEEVVEGETIFGSSEDAVTQLGDRFPGAESAYWNSAKTQKKKYRRAMLDKYSGMIGKNISVMDDEKYKVNSGVVKKVDLVLNDYIEVTYGKRVIIVNPTTGVTVDGFNTVLGWDIAPEYRDKKSKNKVNWNELDRIDGYEHGDLDSMKDMLLNIQEKSGNEESAEHMEYLEGLFGKMDPSFFEKMSLYLNSGDRESYGAVQGDKMNVTLGSEKPRIANRQSDAVIYAHEVIHSMIQFAMKSDDPEAGKIRRELNHIMEVASKTVTWKDFMPDESVDYKAEEKEAKGMFKYMFTSKNASDEFIAHVLTNPIVKKVMSGKTMGGKNASTIVEKIAKIFGTLVDLMLGRYTFKEKNNNVYEQTVVLAVRLGEINNRAMQEVQKNSMASIALDKLNDLDEVVADKLDAVMDKYVRDVSEFEDKPDGGIALGKWRLKVLGKMLTNPEYQKYAKLVLSSFGVKAEGTLRNILSDFGNPDKTEQLVHWLGLASDRIDSGRMTILGAVKKQVYNGFKSKLSKSDESALTKVVIDTDIASIFGKKGYETVGKIAKVFESKEALNRRLSDAKHRLKLLDEENFSWHANNAASLGHYLATHKAHEGQLFNALNIARGIGSDKYKGVNAKLIDTIDEVATLTAIWYSDKRAVAKAVRLMKVEANGVKNVIRLHRNFDKEVRESVFAGSKTHMIKGYSREVFDDRVSMELAPLSQEAEMLKDGYVLKEELNPVEEDSYSEPLGMYISTSFSVGNRLRTATRLTRLGTKGTTITKAIEMSGVDLAERKAEVVKIRMDTKRIANAKRMQEGEIDLESLDYGVAPVMDEDGNITAYRYMMDKESKEKFLGQDTTVAEVMARSYGHTMDKAESREHNKKVLKTIQDDMRVNHESGSKLGKNNEEYREIGPKVHDKEMRALYDILPAEFKRFINNRKDKTMAVRADLVHPYFGYRHASLNDIFPGFTPTMLKTLIRYAEAIWTEVIKIAKSNILLKMPIVLIRNLLSNVSYALWTGISPKEVVSLYAESTRDVLYYIKKSREMEELKLEISTGNTSKNIAMRIKLIENTLKKSPVHELFELGMYSAIVEDVETAELRSTNRVKQKIDDFTQKLPAVFRSPLQVAYLSEDTKWYKVNQEVLQLSDLIARDVQNRKLKLIERQQYKSVKKMPRWVAQMVANTAEDDDDMGMDEYEKLKAMVNGKMFMKDIPVKYRDMVKKEIASARQFALLEMFINYNKPSSKFEEYANRMGVMWFTKYLKRVQKIIGQTAVRHPVKTILMALTQSYLLDFETLQDQTFMDKDVSMLVNTPSDIFENVFTPAIVKPDLYNLGF